MITSSDLLAILRSVRVLNFLDLVPFLNHSRIFFQHCESVG